tara:strand:- start:2703 stop:3215 length:513 start_codon:yes stop_codon:yes gene_type:complete
MKNLERYLGSFAKKVVKGSKNFAKTKGFSDINLSFSVKKKGKGYEIVFKAPFYVDVLDKGVSGNKKTRYYKDYKGAKRKSPFQYKDKAPPSKVFEKWIKKKGIQGRDKKTGRFIKRSSLAFVMAKSMQIKGRDGLGIFQKPLSFEFKRLRKDIVKSLSKDIKEIVYNDKK